MQALFVINKVTHHIHIQTTGLPAGMTLKYMNELLENDDDRMWLISGIRESAPDLTHYLRGSVHQ